MGDLLMPNVFSTVSEEYSAMKECAGLSDLSHWAKLRFSGSDRKSFLHGLLSNDVAGLSAGQGRSFCLLTPKGRLAADLEMYDEGESLLVLTRPASAVSFLAAVSKYLPLSETRLEDAGDTHRLYQLAGPRAPEVLKSLMGELSQQSASSIIAAKWRGSVISVIHPPWIPLPGALLLVPAKAARDLWEEILVLGRPVGLKPVGAEALEVMRVEKGVPVYGEDMDSESLPQEARLDQSICYTKGCYMGQETMSRLKHLGHVNRLLTLLKVSGNVPPNHGSDILSGEEVIGTLSSAVWSFSCQSVLALATVRVAESRAGVSLTVRTASERREALTLPYPEGI